MPISTSEPTLKTTGSTAPASLKAALLEQAARLGLDVVRLTVPADPRVMAERLSHFLAQGRHGDMDWMAETADRRADAAVLWPPVRSIIMVGQSYAPDADPMDRLETPERGLISVYAKRRDYHDVIKAKLKTLGHWLASEAGADARVFVDTAPLMEKPLAAAAGIGWQGKHTNLVSRDFGSWLFLGAILTDAVIDPDEGEDDHCGSCRRCLDVCPTNAFPAPYQLDARRCLAYLTIEHKGHIPREFRAPMRNRIFGCDDCLAVCPWNKFARESQEARLSIRDELDDPPFSELMLLSDADFRKRFAGTPVKRTGRHRFIRNVLIAAGNSQDVAHVPAVRNLLRDQSALVRAMAVWALSQLATTDDFDAARTEHLPFEHDAAVSGEWRAGLYA